MVMIVIYLWCHWYVIQYQDHVFHNMHVSDIRPSTHLRTADERDRHRHSGTRRGWLVNGASRSDGVFRVGSVV